MLYFTFLGVGLASLLCIVAVSYIFTLHAEDPDEFTFKWVFVCVMFALYIAYTVVFKNG